MAPLTVLVSGAGIAGPVCAYWLHRLSSRLIKTTIIERHNGLRKGGQQIDIRGPAIDVVKRMGVLEAIRALTTKEEGLAFIDAKGKRIAEFPVRTEGFSFTSEFEILRENLVKIYYDVTKDETEYIFGNHVTDLNESEDKANVTFANGETRAFDLVVGADGMSSKTRRLAFPGIQTPLKSLGQYISYFTIPFEKQDGTFSQWYNAVGGRSILIRPDNAGCTRAFMSVMSPRLQGYHKLPISGQKAMMREYFIDAGWESERIIKGMEQSDDFYMQEIAQVKMQNFTRGRVALLGDAGYCPSPVSGMGTSLAIVGAYILAGEIARAGPDYNTAFRSYEEKMRPIITKAQALPPGAPAIMSPQSKLGIKLLHKFVSFAAWADISQVISKFSKSSGEQDPLPIYEAKLPLK